MDQYVDCPNCRASNPKKVTFTWWGGLVGPSMFTHVQCQQWHRTYNGKIGKSNFVRITNLHDSPERMQPTPALLTC